MSKNIGDLLRKYRLKKNFTQKDIAYELRKSVRIIQKYESGEVTPSVETIKKLIQILDIDKSFITDTFFINDSIEYKNKKPFDIFKIFLNIQFKNKLEKLTDHEIEEIYKKSVNFIGYNIDETEKEK